MPAVEQANARDTGPGGGSEVEVLRSESDELRSELSLAKTSLGDMVAEFGSLFGGGGNHARDPHELKKMLAVLRAGCADIVISG